MIHQSTNTVRRYAVVRLPDREHWLRNEGVNDELSQSSPSEQFVSATVMMLTVLSFDMRRKRYSFSLPSQFQNNKLASKTKTHFHHQIKLPR